MKHLILILALALTACGGGSSETTQITSPKAVISAPISNIVAFVGDSAFQMWDITQYDKDPTLNFGVSGDTTVQMLARFSDVLAAGPGVVVIMGGGNDLVRAGAVNTESIAAMAKMATDAGVRVILCAVNPLIESPVVINLRNHYPGQHLYNPNIEALNDALLELAEANGYLYADFYDAMLDNGQLDPSLYADGLHPNATGYAKMWAVVQPLIEEDLR